MTGQVMALGPDRSAAQMEASTVAAETALYGHFPVTVKIVLEFTSISGTSGSARGLDSVASADIDNVRTFCSIVFQRAPRMSKMQ